MFEGKTGVPVEEIQRCSLFMNFSEDELLSIARLINIRQYRKGDIIFHEGDIGKEIFILFKGALEISQKLTMLASDSKELDNRDKMLNRLDASSHPIVGEMVLFEEVATRSATLKALEDVTFGVLDKENLLNLVKANPHLGYKLFYNIGIALCTRLNKANRDILKLTTAFTLALEKGV